METKSREIVKDLWAGNFVDWVELGARGTSGGILIMWDNQVVSKTDVTGGSFSLSYLFKNLHDDFEWVLSEVYGPNDDTLRDSF